jgi:sec-independent protein translocase protein TatA
VFSQFGPLEIGLVILVLLLVFGSKRLPALGRQLGTGMREFKDSVTGDRKHDDDDEDVARPALAQSSDAPAAAPESRAADAAPAPERRA